MMCRLDFLQLIPDDYCYSVYSKSRTGFGLNAMNSNYFRVAFSYVKNTLYRTVLYLY